MMPSWRQSSWPSVQVILCFTWYITEYSYALATRDKENCFSAISLLSRSISFTVKVGLSVLMQTFPSLTSRCAMFKLSCSSLRASWTDPTNVFCILLGLLSGQWWFEEWEYEENCLGELDLSFREDASFWQCLTIPQPQLN